MYNIDDYHAIHTWRRPDTVSTSSVKHFVTCVAKKVPECLLVPISAHGLSIHNPRNVDAELLCRQLQLFYANVFDVSHNIQKVQWIAKKLIQSDQFDRVEQLTVHIYDDTIKERKKE